LVPIDRKSSRSAKAPIERTAAGISIIPPTSMSSSNLGPLDAQALLRALDQLDRLRQLVDVAQHRYQDLDLAVMRCAQDRAELRDEEARLRQAEAHRPQPQSRIHRDAIEARRDPFHVLVGAEVERADDEGPPRQARRQPSDRPRTARPRWAVPGG
jgi:hypothetical protein